jgi:transcriptional regulator with XRE-family HTH domain
MIGQFLRDERKRRGMTQRVLADLSGVSINTILNVEKGFGRIDSLAAIISVFWDDMASFGEDYDDWKIQ